MIKVLSILCLIMFSSKLDAKNLEILGRIAGFTAIDANSNEFDFQNKLHGKVWVAFFFFGTCSEICPRLVSDMKAIYKKYPDLIYIGFSVDPKNDTPENLKKFSKENSINELSNFYLLTGDEKKLFQTIEQQFLVPTNLNIHTQKALLIDEKGRIRGYFSVDQQNRQKIYTAIDLLKTK